MLVKYGIALSIAAFARGESSCQGEDCKVPKTGGSYLLQKSILQKESALQTANDCASCGTCNSNPNAHQSVSDAQCAPCANDGQSWWPCNVAGLCQCAGGGPAPTPKPRPPPSPAPVPDACANARAPSFTSALSDGHCSTCNAENKEEWPCNDANLCGCAVGSAPGPSPPSGGGQCVSQSLLQCINEKSNYWPKCSADQSKSVAPPAGYEFGHYCSQEWVDALNDMLHEVGKCEDSETVHELLAQITHETGYFSTVYQPLDGGAGLIHMIPGNWKINAEDMDSLFPGSDYAGKAASMGYKFFQDARYGWLSVAAWYKKTNGVIPGCGDDLFEATYDRQTQCIFGSVHSRKQTFDFVKECMDAEDANPQPQPEPAPDPKPAPKPEEPAPAPKPEEPAPAPKPEEPAPAPNPQPKPNPSPPASGLVAAVQARLEASDGASVFKFETPTGQWDISTLYLWSDMTTAVVKMAEIGVGSVRLWVGESSNDLTYALVNIAAFLAQCMQETIRYNACDENNWSDKAVVADSGGSTYSSTSACGQVGQSYQHYHCSADENALAADDGEGDMACEADPNMMMRATTHAKWYGAPAPLFCAPKSVVPNAPRWDYMAPWCPSKPGQWGYKEPFPADVDLNTYFKYVNEGGGCEDYDGIQTGGWKYQGEGCVNGACPGAPAPHFDNTPARTDLEACCWWGRGVIQTTGTCNFGKLNYFMGARAKRRGANALYPDIDFCKNPGSICEEGSPPDLKWVAGFFYWMNAVQDYDYTGSRGAWNYKAELKKFVDSGMSSSDLGFIDGASGIVNRGCHDANCGTGHLHAADKRQKFFREVLVAMKLVN